MTWKYRQQRSSTFKASFDQLMSGIGLSADEVGGSISFAGSDQIYESRHALRPVRALLRVVSVTRAPLRLKRIFVLAKGHFSK
jgi:hypothetical protein